MNFIAHRIDANGFFLEDVVVYSASGMIDDPNVVTEPLPQPCIKPRWNGSEWVEEDQDTYDRLFSPEAERKRALQEARQTFKRQRTERVAGIQVTTSAGHTFDGDEISQNRMARAVAGLDDGEVMPWVLADNTVIQASRAELREAVRLAGEAQTRIWVESGAR